MASALILELEMGSTLYLLRTAVCHTMYITGFQLRLQAFMTPPDLVRAFKNLILVKSYTLYVQLPFALAYILWRHAPLSVLLFTQIQTTVKISL
jgi:hypothetical protein